MVTVRKCRPKTWKDKEKKEMGILFRYICREIFSVIFIVLFAVVGIYLTVDFFEKIDNFNEAGVPITRALVFFLYKIPFIIWQILPVVVLLSVLITMGLMAKNRELLALKASGVGMKFLLRPVMVSAVLFGILLFFLSEFIVPVTTERANGIYLREVRKESAVVSEKKNIWKKMDRLILNIRYYNKIRSEAHGISLYFFDKQFRLTKRIDARSAVFQDGKWVFFQAMEQVFDNEKNTSRETFLERMTTDIGIFPEALEAVVKKSEEMNFRELFSYVKKIESEGYNASVYRVDLYNKIAYPFICIVMALLAVGIAAREKVGEGLIIGVVAGIGVAFIYWVTQSFCVSLGYGEKLPPWLAAWISSILFFFIGMVLVSYAE